MNGWNGKFLRINLTKNTIKTWMPNQDLYYQYLGGTGIGMKIIYDQKRHLVDAFAPQNLIIFAAGPLTGSKVYGTGRHSVISISPLTNTIFDATTGGYFGAFLKFTGYDGIIIEGKSPNPCYIHIQDSKVEILDASDLWGKDTYETQQKLKEKQEFLRRPTPENFVRKEDCRPGNCLLQQKVFLQRLHSFVNHGITEADFSRLQDKIWLFWPDQSMPLSAVFSGPQTAQFRLAWVIEGCFRKYLESELHWRETRRYPDGFTREELELMGSRFELLDPEERLYLLCREVEMVKKIDQVYRAVIERVNKHAQN